MDHYTAPEFASSALITIDMQNDFGLTTGASPIPGTLSIVPRLVDLLNACRATNRTHSPSSTPKAKRSYGASGYACSPRRRSSGR